MRTMIVRAFVFCLLTVACSAPDGSPSVGPVATPATPYDESGEAIALAKSCTLQNGYRAVWGTAPLFDEPHAFHMRDRAWAVSFPESGVDDAGAPVMLGLPVGLMVSVDLDAKSCRRMMQE